MKTNFPNLQNRHENALNHDDPDDSDDGSRECKNVLECAEKAC